MIGKKDVEGWQLLNRMNNHKVQVVWALMSWSTLKMMGCAVHDTCHPQDMESRVRTSFSDSPYYSMAKDVNLDLIMSITRLARLYCHLSDVNLIRNTWDIINLSFHSRRSSSYFIFPQSHIPYPMLATK